VSCPQDSLRPHLLRRSIRRSVSSKTFSSQLVIRVCHNPSFPYMLMSHSVINMTKTFGNDLGVNAATHIGIEEQTERMFVSRGVSGSSPDAAADIIVLLLQPSCGMSLENRVFVQPQPVAITVAEAMGNAGAFMYWPMDSPTTGGRLYRWDLQGSDDVANITLGLAPGSVFSPVGFAEVRAQMAFYGVVASAAPGTAGIVASVINAGDPFHVDVFEVACKAQLAIDLPTAYASVAGSSIVFASGAGSFSLVRVPQPTASLSLGVSRRRNALASCQPLPFGLPPTCAGCVPPSATCGMTQHCTTGCCFVQGGKVMCCTQSPPGLTMPGFSCS
jgi:hypothetical protein